MGAEGEWDSGAQNWVRWARTPGHDAYWYWRDAFFDAVVPRAGRRTLEIGCGEGRVARDLGARGHRVVAIDSAHTLLRHARHDDDTAGEYVRADGATLPFPDASFDLAVAYNSLQVVGDMRTTVRETARVLERGGRLCACVAHPVTDLGRFGDGSEPTFTMRPDYFENVRVDETVELDGLTVTFRGWTYALEHYARALEEAGFLVEMIREPRPTAPPPRYQQWLDVPLFLFVRAVKA